MVQPVHLRLRGKEEGTINLKKNTFTIRNRTTLTQAWKDHEIPQHQAIPTRILETQEHKLPDRTITMVRVEWETPWV